MGNEFEEINKLLTEIKEKQQKLLDIGYDLKCNHKYNKAFYEIAALVDLIHNIDNRHLIDNQIKLIKEAMEED